MSIYLEIIGKRAIINIDRPAKRNAFTMEMWRALPMLLDEVSKSNAKLVILKSATAGMFSAGADIKELLEHKDDNEWVIENQEAINSAFQTLAAFELPTIAQIDGDCIGGGCGLALACDIRVATENARLGITPAKLGIVYPLHDTKLLVDLVGPSKAKFILYSGSFFDAQKSLQMGLIDAIDDDIERIAAPIEACSRFTQISSKRMISRVLNGQFKDDEYTLGLFRSAFSGKDFNQGVQAFIEKRKPDFE